jgi:glycosyltransferase involved in cell wall biosynthesis
MASDYPLREFIGGSVRLMYEESTRLAEKGHKVHMLTREELIRQGYDEVKNIQEWKYPVNNNNSLLFLKTTLSNSRRLFETLSKKFKYQVLNFHQPFSAFGILKSPQSDEISKIYTCHSLSFEEYKSRNPNRQRLIDKLFYPLNIIGRKYFESSVLKKSDFIVVLSHYTADRLYKLHGIAPHKIIVIPGGADLHRFRPSNNKAQLRLSLDLPKDLFILLTVRNLVPRMGLENLITALKMVLSHRRDLLLIIGGEGPLGPALEKHARSLGISEFIRFAGHIPDSKLPRFYQMADLFILPTRELEGFGLVTVEALASGLPVLGTPVGATKEILTKLGPDYLFDDTTADSIAAGILRALRAWPQNQATYDYISRTCRKVAEQHYSWDNRVRQLEELYYSILDR